MALIQRRPKNARRCKWYRRGLKEFSTPKRTKAVMRSYHWFTRRPRPMFKKFIS